MAQNVRVTGKVVDKNGEPLMGVSIMLDGTKTGTASELDGTYVIEVPSNGVLVFSAIGMETKKENVNGRKVINVTLGESTVILDELVVTALGIKKERKALGYAVQDLKSDEILKNKQTNVINSLAGKVAGVNITQSSGAAGAGATIIVRVVTLQVRLEITNLYLLLMVLSMTTLLHLQVDQELMVLLKMQPLLVTVLWI